MTKVACICDGFEALSCLIAGRQCAMPICSECGFRPVDPSGYSSICERCANKDEEE